MIEFTLGEPIPEGAPTLRRLAVRAVVWRGERLLLVRTNKGDYKFPGGGQETGEDDAQTLVRETLEETGYLVRPAGALFCRAIERRRDLYDESQYFYMTSLYYPCELCAAENSGQRLSGYEVALEMAPVFVEPREAIAYNERLMQSGVGVLRWVERETRVLRALCAE